MSIFSDERFRGYSLSAGQPVAIVDVSYDHSSGLYADVSASAVASSDHGLRPLGLQLNGGYAKRLSSGLSLDVGVIHSRYSEYSSRGQSNAYTELYAGLSGKLLSSRVYFSPHYFGYGTPTLYGELDANLTPLAKVRLNGHFGVLVPLSTEYDSPFSRTQYDWRLAAARELGRASLEVALTGGGPGRDVYDRQSHRRTALVLGLRYAF